MKSQSLNKMKFWVPVLAVMAMLFTSSQVMAVKYVTKKGFIKKNLPSGIKLSKKKVALSAERKKDIEKNWNARAHEDTVELIIARDKKGNPAGAVYFTTLYVTEHRCVHRVGLALKADGKVKELAITEIFCEIGMTAADQSFLGQFEKKQKKSGPLHLNKDISAVTGATLSSEALVKLTNLITGIYKYDVLK